MVVYDGGGGRNSITLSHSAIAMYRLALSPGNSATPYPLVMAALAGENV